MKIVGVTFRVTEADIKEAQRRRRKDRRGAGNICQYCPVALAAQRKFKSPYITASWTQLDFHGIDGLYEIKGATKIVNAFDAGNKVHPATITVVKRLH